jgi:hypothetical protein
MKRLIRRRTVGNTVSDSTTKTTMMTNPIHRGCGVRSTAASFGSSTSIPLVRPTEPYLLPRSDLPYCTQLICVHRGRCIAAPQRALCALWGRERVGRFCRHWRASPVAGRPELIRRCKTQCCGPSSNRPRPTLLTRIPALHRPPPHRQRRSLPRRPFLPQPLTRRRPLPVIRRRLLSGIFSKLPI